MEKYLIDIYDKVPLLGAMALFIPLCGDVDRISDAMRCGPFVAKYIKRSKYAASCWYFSNTSDAHWGSAQCTEDEIEIFPEHEDLCDPLRTVQQCQKCGR